MHRPREFAGDLELVDSGPPEFGFLPTPDCVYALGDNFAFLYVDPEGARADIAGILGADPTWEQIDEINWNNQSVGVVTVRDDLTGYVPYGYTAGEVLEVDLSQY